MTATSPRRMLPCALHAAYRTLPIFERVVSFPAASLVTCNLYLYLILPRPTLLLDHEQRYTQPTITSVKPWPESCYCCVCTARSSARIPRALWLSGSLPSAAALVATAAAAARTSGDAVPSSLDACNWPADKPHFTAAKQLLCCQTSIGLPLAHHTSSALPQCPPATPAAACSAPPRATAVGALPSSAHAAVPQASPSPSPPV